MKTVEDYIEILAGIQEGGDAIKLDKSDYNLITSLARQTFRGIAYTDRQCALAKNKIEYYSSQLNQSSFLVNELDNLRMPLRNIDRSRWIKIVDDLGDNSVYERNKSPFIAIRFTFQKKLISALEKLPSKPYYYDKTKKIQYFEYSEKTLFNIVNAFKERNFEIDDTIKDIYDKIALFDEESSVPGVYNFELKNLPELATKLIIEDLGTVNPNNIMLYKDRSLRYGINVEYTGETNSLESKIANRRESNVSIDFETVTIDTLLLALENLKRHKLMILVSSNDDNSTYDSVLQAHQYIKNLVPSNEISVSFRLDNINDGLEFNNYIKREKINNKVDINTKVVYNLNNKLPKPLLQTGWVPDAILLLNSNGFIATRKVIDCYPGVDLVIHQHQSISVGYGTYMKRGVQKL